MDFDYPAAVTAATDAAESYYSGSGIKMSDAAYDELVEAIAAYESAHPDERIDHGLVDQVAAGTGKGDVPHSVPMLSLDKVRDPEPLAAWVGRVLPDIADTTDGFVVEPKLDGIAISAEYADGHLVRVLTRGDGRKGEDVTAKLPSEVVGLPRRIGTIGEHSVRGELIFTSEQFVEANYRRVVAGKPEFVNPRNALAGSVRRDDLTPDERAPMTFFAYSVVWPSTQIATHFELMAELDGLGFCPAVVLGQRYAGFAAECNDLGGITERIEAIGAHRSEFPCDLDGAVVKVNEIAAQESLGATGSHPRWAMAWKYPAEEATTTLLDIEVQVGRTGIHSLRGRLDPVFVGGTTITYATLHNPSDLEARDVRPGDTVMVRRAGDVIPEITGHTFRPIGSQPWVMPTNCIECGEPLDTSEKRWRCVNRDCPAGAAALLVYACSRDALDIEGAGEAVIGTLFEHGKICDLSDLADLKVSDIENLPGFGKTSAQKLVDEIAKAKTQPLHRLITALGIRMTGRRMSKRLSKHFGRLGAFRATSAVELEQIEGIGKVRAATIHAEIIELSPLLDRLVEQGWNAADESIGIVNEGPKPLDGETVVVTGSVPGYGRNEVRDLIERLGGKSASSVTSKTTLLISSGPGSSKHAKAVELGIDIQTPEYLLTLDQP